MESGFSAQRGGEKPHTGPERGLFCRMFRFLKVPPYVREEFIRESVQKNDFSLRIISAIIFAVELYNIARVLLWSSSGLGTLNNRIYFSMYCALILIAALWLAARRPLRRAPAQAQWKAQYAVTWLLFLWHMGLNTYDLYRDPAAGTTVLTTALLGLALFIQSPPAYSAVQIAAGYGLFLAVMAPLLDAGSRLNLTITFVVALSVSQAHARHAFVTLKQQKQIVEMNEKLRKLAQQDPLTGLLNKTTLECRAEQLLGGRGPAGGGLTLFLLDLDQFKEINDRCGHPCGDHVLAETAEVMRRVFSEAAGLGRIGGDEFAVLYDRPLAEEEARGLSRSLLQGLEGIRWQDRPLEVGCSVGVCVCAGPGRGYRQLYAETDRLLYQAKESGRGQCCVAHAPRPD